MHCPDISKRKAALFHLPRWFSKPATPSAVWRSARSNRLRSSRKVAGSKRTGLDAGIRFRRLHDQNNDQLQSPIECPRQRGACETVCIASFLQLTKGKAAHTLARVRICTGKSCQDCDRRDELPVLRLGRNVHCDKHGTSVTVR